MSIEETPEELCTGNYFKLHEIGRIQTPGFVLGVERIGEVLKVISVSDNIVQATWAITKKVEEILNCPLESVIGTENSLLITKAVFNFPIFNTTEPNYQRSFALLKTNTTIPQIKNMTEIMLSCSLMTCSTPNQYVIEIEEVEDTTVFTLPNGHMIESGNMVNLVQTAESLEAVTALFCDRYDIYMFVYYTLYKPNIHILTCTLHLNAHSVMKIMPDYDRGVVCRFEDDYSSEVIYENIRDPEVTKSTFLNFHYPASDVPPQSRALLMKNIVRYIYDVNGTEAVLHALEDVKLDLTMCYMRAVHNCHLQYLKNMGVVASLTIAIVVNKKVRIMTLYVYV